MFTTHYITDAAVTLPSSPRTSVGLAQDDKPARGRMAGLIAGLRRLWPVQPDAR